METRYKKLGLVALILLLPVIMGSIDQYSMTQLLGKGLAAIISGFNINGDFNVIAYGAKGDDQPGLANGALTGSTFVRSDGGAFVAADVGKSINVAGAGLNFNALETTIIGFTSSTTVTVATSATQNVSGKDWSYGTNNSAAFQACLTAAGVAGKDCYAPAGKYYLSTPVYSGNAAGEIVQLVSQTIGTGDGVTKTFSGTLGTSSTNSALCTAAGHTTPCTAAILRDSVFLSEENVPANTGRVTFVDEDNNGLGVFNGPAGLSTPGAVNYTTGAISSTINSLCTGSTAPLGCCTGAGAGTCGSAGFATAPASGAPIVVNYYLVPNANQPNQIYGITGAAGFNGAGSAATQIDCGPSIKSYCLRASGISGKTFRNFSMQSDFNIFSSPGVATDGNQMAFGGALFAIDGGAPSATNRFLSIETDYFQMVGSNLDLQNDSTIVGVYATGMPFSNSYSIFANGNGGPEHLEDVKADHPVDVAGQQVGIYNSGLYGGLRLFSSDNDWITVQNSQVWADTISGCAVTTLTGITNQGVANGLDLDNVMLSPNEGSGAVCGHWVTGGHWKNPQFLHGPAFNLTQGPGNANIPYFEILGSGGIGGNSRLSFTNASGVPAKIKWCTDGSESCSYNYDVLASTGTTFAGTGTPSAPTVTQLGTPGVGTCVYFQVDVGRNGKDSIPSTGTTITNCSSSLATNNVKICPSYNVGASSYKILKTNTSTQLGAVDAGGGTSFPSQAGCFLDTGGSTSAYTPQTVDQTDIMNSASSASPLMLGWGGVVKQSGAPGAAIGGGKCEFFAVAGTNAGTCKLQAICGTSTTPVTITDNIGAGC